ncbi:MAG: bifunctional nuclease family protein [Patescibacteria group bacterium]|nr:bifunctional nuclease family protein [Patescibacteria group bacterium]MDE2015181.1 bifunctional nuclease family protein [Patescibacteria group bacterium]MDE2226609.1 bifunctional nuclease family protein [Patescibacteria group bacterium]
MEIEVTVNPENSIVFINGDLILLVRNKITNSPIPIWIGPWEAQQILAAANKIEPPRPMPYDLLKNAVVSLGAMMTKAVITEIKDDVFYALIHLDRNGEKTSLDCRPSDAVALALKFEVPIFVTEELLLETMTDEKTNLTVDLIGRMFMEIENRGEAPPEPQGETP